MIFLFAFFNRSYLQVFIYRLCELSPYPAIRYAFNVSLNTLWSRFLPLLSHTVMRLCIEGLCVFRILYTGIL